MTKQKSSGEISSQLESKIKNRQAVIAVIGLGYVGLPLVVSFGKSGFSVKGVDVDSSKIQQIALGKSPVMGIPDQDLAMLQGKNRLEVSGNFQILSSADVTIICVPTPLSKSLDPDLSFIANATREVSRYLRKSQLIILESTTYPGTTEEILLPEFQKRGLVPDKDFFLCFSPERIDPGNKQFSFKDIPKIVGGVSPKSTALGVLLYQQIVSKVVPVSSPRAAEMAKLLENTFRIVNIGLINELATVAKDLNIDIWEVIEAASTKPFGFMPFYPGPGIGGHCIGVDPLYLSWKAKFHGRELRFIELARQMNAFMPEFVAGKVTEILNQRTKPVRGSRILILGVAYKKDVDDTRESPAFAIMEKLAAQGAEINYHDPWVSELSWNGRLLRSLRLTPEVLKKSDLVLITTDHSSISYDLVVKYSQMILDTRNVLRQFSGQAKNIMRL